MNYRIKFLTCFLSSFVILQSWRAMVSSRFWCCLSLFFSWAFLMVFSCVYGEDIKGVVQVVQLTHCFMLAEIYSSWWVCAEVLWYLTFFNYCLHTLKQGSSD